MLDVNQQIGRGLFKSEYTVSSLFLGNIIIVTAFPIYFDTLRKLSISFNRRNSIFLFSYLFPKVRYPDL